MSNAERVLLHDASVRECRYAAEIVEATHDLQQQMTAKTGRPKVHSATTMLTLMLLACDMRDGSKMLFLDVVRVARALTPKQREIVGVSDRVREGQVYRFVQEITERELVPDLHGQVSDTAFTFTMDDLASTLVRSVIPAQIPETGEYAIDGTDVEAWANAYRAGEFCPEGRCNHSECAHQKSRDPDARWGYRTASQNTTELFLGYTAHIATDVPLLGEQVSRPPLIRGLVLRPAGSHAAHAGIDVIDGLQRRTRVEHVLSDRAYTNGGYENCGRELTAREITQSLDLHPQQIGAAPGPRNLPRTEFLDGTLFTKGMPPRLRNLKRTQRFHDKAAHAQAVGLFDERAQYAFRPFSEGSRRFRGPAVKGHERVRCVNAPASIKKTHLPLTNCKPGMECSCARTVTLKDHPRPELAQHFAWGTSDWEADYGRRSAIEAVNSFLKSQGSSMQRGSIRVMGRAKVALALGVMCAVTNLRMIRDRYGVIDPNAGVAEPLAKPGRTPYRARYKGVANPRAGRGRAPTKMPAAMVPPKVGGLNE